MAWTAARRACWWWMPTQTCAPCWRRRWGRWGTTWLRLRVTLILLGPLLTTLDGLHFPDLYREVPGWRAPVVVLTAAPLPARGAVQRGAVAVAVLAKPFDVDQLVALVDRHVGSGLAVGIGAAQSQPA